jgi:superfamily II DNA/RNA helicase
MSTKFFTNTDKNNLLNKFNGVFDNNHHIQKFHCISAYFRSSGYCKIQAQLSNMQEVQILVGIKSDITELLNQQTNLILFDNNQQIKEEWCNKAIKMVKEKDEYTQENDNSSLSFWRDLTIPDTKIELRIHPSKNLHAKIYIFLPDPFNAHTPASVITGSSNFTATGLGNNKKANSRYEFNVELRDYDDVKFAEDEFQKLWSEGIPVTKDDILKIQRSTHLTDKVITPYELFIKSLIEYWGEQIDYDKDSIGIPATMRLLKYQIDAVNQGYKTLLDYNGCFLADVVGLGKTIVATMIAKKLIHENGMNTKILIVYPPTLEKNWKETFKEFRLDGNAEFVSIGRLSKISNMFEYSFIIIDESHRLRNAGTNMYDQLQRITKSPIDDRFIGRIIKQKKILLLSATPFNNAPQDILNQISLFTDRNNSSLTIKNLQNYFNPKISKYKELIKRKETDNNSNVGLTDSVTVINAELKQLMTKIRDEVLKEITVRRIRKDLINNTMYLNDLNQQGIKFPKIEEPTIYRYRMNNKLVELLQYTIHMVDERLTYQRYTMINALKEAVANKIYDIQIDLVARNLSALMKNRLFKALESSFEAFKSTLSTLYTSTNIMLEMIAHGTVYLAPNSQITEWVSDDELDFASIELKVDQHNGREGWHKFPVETSFDQDKLQLAKTNLINDQTNLADLLKRWQQINTDPKLEEFIKYLPSIINGKHNPSKKLIIFSESAVTGEYLNKRLQEYQNYSGSVHIGKVLSVSSKNRRADFDIIRANFDANYPLDKQKNDYSILVTTEVLAEGVNLHRANCILNYDIPWNSTKLMQRIGRVNRIGSTADKIYNYAFYPSKEIDKIINLRNIAHTKLQSFHYTYGEDAQILSTDEELLGETNIFSNNKNNVESENADDSLKYLQIIRELRDSNKQLFMQIKQLPPKSHTIRNGTINSSVVFLRNGSKAEFYECQYGEAKAIAPIDAFKRMEASLEEAPIKVNTIPAFHYDNVQLANTQFMNTQQQKIQEDNTRTRDPQLDNISKELRAIKVSTQDELLKHNCEDLEQILKQGTYDNTKFRSAIKSAIKNNNYDELKNIAKRYPIQRVAVNTTKHIAHQVKIILSESFYKIEN